MKKIIIVLLVLAFCMSYVLPCSAQKNSYVDIIRSGLLGAGAGAVGGAASGGDGNDIWKGALAGAGVNIVGGALLDSITRQTTTQTRSYYAAQPRYAQSQYVPYRQPVTYSQPRYSTRNTYSDRDTYEDGYQDGYYLGYKEGYAQGLKDGIREALD